MRFATECLAFANVPSPARLRDLEMSGPADARWKAGVPRDLGANWDFEGVRDHYVGALYGADAQALRASDPQRYFALGRAATAELAEAVFAEWRRTGSSCGGGLVWFLNDLAPGAGWGALDDKGDPKSLWYALRRAFRPIHLGITDEGLNGLGLHLGNETASARTLRLTLQCFGEGPHAMAKAERDIMLAPREFVSLRSNALLGRFFDITYAYRFGPPAHDATVARLLDPETGAIIAELTHVLAGHAAAARDIGLAAEVAWTDSGPALDVGTERFARFVTIDDERCVASDQGFCLVPGERRRVALVTKERRLETEGRDCGAQFHTSQLRGGPSMIPVSFGNNAARLHLPAADSLPSGLGVVIVPPHGIEALAAAKTLRLLAEELAKRGHSVLRFDLPGTGDLLDDDLPADATSCWTEFVVEAANTLQTSAGASGIVLVGLRLGALLAASAAPGVEDLEAVALLDPVISGRSYARELDITAQAFAEETGLDPADARTAQGLMIGGLETTRETLAGLRKLTLLELTPAVPTLLLHRDGARDAREMIARWPAMKVTSEPAQGFEAIRSNPTYAVTPHAALLRTADWIDRLPKRAPRPHDSSHSSQLTSANFTETSIVFGPESRLFGVICRPSVPAENHPALIIMNAGRNPHIGWARSSVTLARRLAADGVATIRFDLGGIGDSVDRPGAADHVDELLYSDDQDAELTAAIELSRRLGFSTTTLLGACSGAYLALRGGVQTSSVKNVILINLQRFVWRNGETVTSALKNNFAVSSSYLRRIGDARAWRLLLSGERKLGALVLNLLARAIKRLSCFGMAPETVKAEALMRAISDRKSSVDFIYSEDDSGLVELAHHFGARGRKLLKDPLVRFHFVANSDHNFTPPTARERVYEITRNAILAPQ